MDRYGAWYQPHRWIQTCDDHQILGGLMETLFLLLVGGLLRCNILLLQVC